MNRKHAGRKIAKMIVLIPLGLALLTWVVMSLWNHILPQAITGVNTISFWHALGILVLSKILFGGFKGGWGSEKKRKWKNKFHQKWQQMTPEEQESFRNKWYSSCYNTPAQKPEAGAGVE